MRIIKRKKTAMAIAALAAVLALTGMAYAAARSGILDKLFTRAEPGETAQRLVVPVGVSDGGEWGGYTVNEYIFDGQDLYVDSTLTLSGDEGLIVLGCGPAASLAGEGEAWISQDDVTNFGGACRWAEGSLSGLDRIHFYGDVPGEPFEASMRVALLRPDGVAPIVSAEDGGDILGRPVWVDTGDGRLMYCDYLTHDGGGSSCGLSVEEPPVAEGDPFEARLSWLEASGYGTVVAVCEVSFPVLPQGAEARVLAAPVRMELEGFTLTVTDARFTGVTAQIRCALEWEDGWNAQNADLAFDVLADGEKILMSDMGDDRSIEFWSEGGCSLLPEKVTLRHRTSGREVTVKLK